MTRCVCAGGLTGAWSTLQVAASINWPHLGLPHRRGRRELLRRLMFLLSPTTSALLSQPWRQSLPHVGQTASQRGSQRPGVPSRGCRRASGKRCVRCVPDACASRAEAPNISVFFPYAGTPFP